MKDLRMHVMSKGWQASTVRSASMQELDSLLPSTFDIFQASWYDELARSQEVGLPKAWNRVPELLIPSEKWKSLVCRGCSWHRKRYLFWVFALLSWWRKKSALRSEVSWICFFLHINRNIPRVWTVIVPGLACASPRAGFYSGKDVTNIWTKRRPIELLHHGLSPPCGWWVGGSTSLAPWNCPWN